MTMRWIGLALLLSAGASGPAFAQGGRAGSPPTVHDWSGFYVGASLGGGTGTSQLRVLRSPVQQVTTTTTTNLPDRCQTDIGALPLIGPAVGYSGRTIPLYPLGNSSRDQVGTFIQSGYYQPYNLLSAYNLVNVGSFSGNLQGQRLDFDDYRLAPNAQAGAFETLDNFGVRTCMGVNYGQVFPDQGPFNAGGIGLANGPGATPGNYGDGLVVPGGTTTTTTTTTGIAGPFAGRTINAATLAALAALPSRRISTRMSGVVGGGQAGYNYQIGAVVIGVEADLHGSDIGAAGRTGSFSQRSSINWYGTARIRVGYALDRLLVYSTGGLAYGDVNLTYGLGNLSVGETRLQVGWTAGSGVEYALTPQVSVKAEYKHIELGSDTFLRRVGYDARMRVAADTGVIGLNYRW